MSVPVDRWPEIFRAFGCDVVEVPGWETRGRPYAMTNEAVMGHHDGAPWTWPESQHLRVAANGLSRLPGPLYSVMIGYENPPKTHLVSAGYCNNAGRGVSDVLARVRAGLRPLGHALPTYGRLRGRGDVARNGAFRSVAMMGGTKTSIPSIPMQDEHARAVAALVYIDHRPDPDQDIGAFYVEHREWTSRKIDPLGATSDQMREKIWAAYRAGYLALHEPPPAVPSFRIRDAVGVVDSLDAGYWIVASDGGVFSFAGAAFHGSLGAIQLAAPIVDLVPVPSGYYLIGADGGVFAFGSALFSQSASGRLGDGVAVGGLIHEGRLYIATDQAGVLHDVGPVS